jgi:hypothetical protein
MDEKDKTPVADAGPPQAEERALTIDDLVVLEIVSHRPRDEDGHTMTRYAQIGVRYYVIFDPEDRLGGGVLRSFERQDGGAYRPLAAHWFPAVKLGVKLWEGEFARARARWLRWCDRHGRVILSGRERAEQERQHAKQELQRAEQEHRRAEEYRRAAAARQRCERLEAQLRALGIEPAP